MRPKEACTSITSTLGAASRSRVAVMGASSSVRVRGSRALAGAATSSDRAVVIAPSADRAVNAITPSAADMARPSQDAEYVYVHLFRSIYTFVKRIRRNIVDGSGRGAHIGAYTRLSPKGNLS